MIASPARLWTVPGTCRVEGMPFQGSRYRWASPYPCSARENFVAGGCLAGRSRSELWPWCIWPRRCTFDWKFPNKRDERTINIYISSPASKRRWIVTVSSSWYKPRDAWHLLWMKPNVIQTTWPIRVDWSRDIGRFYTKDAAIIRLDELGQTFCSSSGYASLV